MLNVFWMKKQKTWALAESSLTRMGVASASTNTEAWQVRQKSNYTNQWSPAVEDHNVDRNEQEGMLLSRISNDGDDSDDADDDVGMKSCSHLNTDTNVLAQCCFTRREPSSHNYQRFCWQDNDDSGIA